MTLTITGATGHLGRLVVHSLLARGVAAEDVRAVGRDARRLEALAALGVQTRVADYEDRGSVDAALAGTDRLLFISASTAGPERPRQHQVVIDAAVGAGVSQVAYTSIVGATSSPMQLAREHAATEQALAASGLAVVLLRNSWYLENYSAQVQGQLAAAVVLGAAGDGRVSAATRADYAEAAAVALTQEGHAGHTYELGGDDAFTLSDYAATLSRVAGQAVVYQDVPEQVLAEQLASFGLPGAVATMLADSDAGIARGDLLVETGDLARLIGRPTVGLEQHLREVVQGLGSVT